MLDFIIMVITVLVLLPVFVLGIVTFDKATGFVLSKMLRVKIPMTDEELESLIKRLNEGLPEGFSVRTSKTGKSLVIGCPNEPTLYVLGQIKYRENDVILTTQYRSEERMKNVISYTIKNHKRNSRTPYEKFTKGGH